MNIYNKHCIDDCNVSNKDQRYTAVAEHVRKMNSIVVRNIAISGEGVYGTFTGFAELNYLRLCIQNGTYHPYLYHYSVGASVGSVIIVIILNTRFLFEMVSTEVALAYLYAILDFFSFDTVRSIFFDLGENKVLGDFKTNEALLVLNNLFTTGALCRRDQLIDFLQGNHKKMKFDNKKKYFTSKEYYEWLIKGKNLDNVFIVCYSMKQTKMSVFTGNRNRIQHGALLIDYEPLTPDNLIESVICSSAVVGLYPQNNINRDKAIDGSTFELNQVTHLNIITQLSEYISPNVLYTPLLNFFEIRPENNNNFQIIVNKLNSQCYTEDIVQFPESAMPLVNTLITKLSVLNRFEYNARINVPLTAMLLTQPYIKYYSVNDFNKNALGPLEQKNKILKKHKIRVESAIKQKRIPTFLLTEEQFKSDIFGMKLYFVDYGEFVKAYHKYNPINSNLMISTYLNKNKPPETVKLLDQKYKEQIDADGKHVELTLNVCTFDVFVRQTRNYKAELLEYKMIFNIDTGTVKNLLNIGFITGDMLYDIHVRQLLTTNTVDKVTCPCVKPFVTDLTKIVEKGCLEFLGPNQS